MGAAGLLTAGCSAGEVEPAPSSSAQYLPCKAERTNEWTKVAPNLRLDTIADKLDVQESKVAAGVMALAVCEPGIPVEQIAGGKPITIAGMPSSLGVSDKCLALMSDVPPSPGAFSRHVGAVCPIK